MKYHYKVAVLGLTLNYEAASLPSLRQRILVKYLRYIGPDQRHWPLVPTIILLGTNDPRVPRAELNDSRLHHIEQRAPSHAANATNLVTSLEDWKNRASNSTEATDSGHAETDQSN